MRKKSFSELSGNAVLQQENITKSYGEENIDYPDPRCIYAPNFINTITHD